VKKIPTLYVRNPLDRRHVIPGDVTPGCEWVLDGQGTPTRKYDGTCMRKRQGQWSARREVKPGKAIPEGFEEAHFDRVTGKRFGWVPIEQSPFVAYWREAVATGGDLPEGTYELCGPNINGNPERFPALALMLHEGAMHLGPDDADPLELIEICRKEGYEGIVWHHQDREMMAKLKVRDMP